MDDPGQANPREHLRQAIDAEIKTLEESIRALKYRRNALAPVSSIPTEAIAAIFSFLCFTSASHVAHVCHQWREIALNQPLLWSRVDFTNLTLVGAGEILDRAKDTPLHLVAKFNGSHWNNDRFRAFEKVLLPHVPHTFHLSIHSELGQVLSLRKVLEGFNSSPAPTLEHLSLSHDGRLPSRVSIPDTLFNGTTHRLSSLELRNCDISWKSPLLNGLKYLELRTPNARPSLAYWLDALNEMPQLERLVLHSASPIAPPFPFDVRRTVTLPFLTHLEISDRVRNCALPLAHLVLPAITRLCLTAWSDHPRGNDVPELLPYVARHAHGPQDDQPLQSMLIFGESMRTHILAWPGADVNVKVNIPADLRAAALTARLALSVKHNKNVLHYETFLEAAMETLPLNGLVRFAARQRRLDEYFWRGPAPQWPLLQRVRLGFQAVRGFTEVLLKHDEDGRESPLLPSLTRLDLIDGTELYEERPLSRLCDALRQRVEQGVPLETLDLCACRATNSDVRLLREIVANVLAPVWHPSDDSDYSNEDGVGYWNASDDDEDEEGDDDNDEDEDEEWETDEDEETEVDEDEDEEEAN